jgi:hypothetical protein
MFFAVHDQNTPPQQIGDRVRVTPQNFITFSDEYFAICFRSKNHIWAKTRDGDLKKTTDMLSHHLERSER